MKVKVRYCPKSASGVRPPGRWGQRPPEGPISEAFHLECELARISLTSLTCLDVNFFRTHDWRPW